MAERGNEFGATTGRARRCGWFDAVLVRQTCAISGVTGIALTKIDVLDGLEELQICVGYRLDGKLVDLLPIGADRVSRCEPVYEKMPGWKEKTFGIKLQNSEAAKAALKSVRSMADQIRECQARTAVR